MKKKTEPKSGLRKKLVNMTTIPILISGIVIMVFSYFDFTATMNKEIQHELRNSAMATLYAYDDLFEGQFEVTDNGDDTYGIVKVEDDLAEELAYIDNIKADTGIDTTLFYFDVRFLTTIRDVNGTRIVGTVANKNVSADVLKEETPKFYDNVLINGERYYAYYAPALNHFGRCVGMVFAGRPISDVRNDIMQSVLPIIGISVIMMILMIFVASSSAKELAGVINKEKVFLGAIAQGNLRADLDARILARKDELGEMGRFTVHVQKFIRDMIERDTLTKLYTRRIGEVKIQYAQQQSIETNSPYCVAMADIDFFKKFNDQYGHDCGDLVLKETAAIFNKTLYRDGFAVRWGGEEFIIIYENMNITQAYAALSKLREAVINNELEYKDEKLKITMTFGLVSGDERSINDIVKEADDLLYQGKQNGRNQIVAKLPESEEA